MKTLKIGLLSTVLMLATGTIAQSIEKPVHKPKKEIKIHEMKKMKAAPANNKADTQRKVVTKQPVKSQNAKKKLPVCTKMEPAKATK